MHVEDLDSKEARAKRTKCVGHGDKKGQKKSKAVENAKLKGVSLDEHEF